MSKYVNSIIDTIHDTPLLRLNNIEKKYNLQNKIFAKLEVFNPYGSVKDRVVLSMVEDAEAKGLITPGKTTIVESTSGNTGIALSSIGRMKGYKVVIVMSERASIERRKMIEYFGAELIIMPASMSRVDIMEEVNRMQSENDNYFWLNQYSNEANPEVHYQKTAKEIWNDLDGEVDVFVSGLGTGGTLRGASRYFREHNEDVQII